MTSLAAKGGTKWRDNPGVGQKINGEDSANVMPAGDFDPTMPKNNRVLPYMMTNIS
jgi:hypothetical protein